MKKNRFILFCPLLLLVSQCAGTRIGTEGDVTTGSFGEDAGLEFFKSRHGDVMVKVDKNQSKTVGKLAGAWLGDKIAGRAENVTGILAGEKTARAANASAAANEGAAISAQSKVDLLNAENAALE